MHNDENSAESMRILRSHSNSRLPISRLPNEILLNIFKYYEEETRLDGYNNDDDSSASDEIDDVPACLVVTHVCRHWRKVALECPTLWKFINSTSSVWLDLVLERSQKVPLVVTYSSVSISLENCLEKVLLHLPRIKYLELRVFSYDVDRVMDLLSSQPALMLETFKFSVNGRVPTVSMSNTIFRGQAPLLRHLDISNCGHGWTSCIFGGLRTLHIGHMQLPDVLAALQCMPSLEQLTFQDDLLQSDEPQSDELILIKVPLARLKNIALDGTPLQNAISLFTHLTLPADIKIALQLSLVEGPETFADLFSVMDMRPHGSGPVFRSLRAIQIEPWLYAVQFSTSTAINSVYFGHPQDDDIRLSIEFYYFEDGEEIPRGLIFDICEIIAQRRRQTFFSGKFESISVDGETQFIGGLTAALRIEGSSNIPYPSLRVLELIGVYFEGDEFQDLLDVLTMRVQHNVPLYDLRLRICNNFPSDPVVAFREVAQVVNDFDR